MKFASRSGSIQVSAQAVGLLCLIAFAPLLHAQTTTSYNTGSLGVTGDGVNASAVTLDQPGALAAPFDYSNSYATGANTIVPFRAALNPAANQPFTIEFWAYPTAFDTDDAPVGNRVTVGVTNRSGWVFFQRDAAIGWNFRIYDGVGSSLGWDLTGGTSTLNAWSHVVVVWTGSAATLYVNGALASSTNGTGASGNYNPNTADGLYLGALINGSSPSTGRVDEVAFYPTALSAAKIQAHYTTASSTVAGAYSSLVLADGAVEYLQQNPPTVKISTVGITPTVTFTGILSQSPDLKTWTDLTVTSPYTPTGTQPGKLFFRSHR